MKVYNLDGKAVTVDKEQMEIVLDAGWSKTKPEVETEEEKQAKIDADDAQALADKEAEEAEEAQKTAEATKPKKIRKILKKKK